MFCFAPTMCRYVPERCRVSVTLAALSQSDPVDDEGLSREYEIADRLERLREADGRVGVSQDGIPLILDGWFTASPEQRYLGLLEDDAIAAAESIGITEIRLFHAPSIGVWMKDYLPKRLNFVIAENRVIRAAFF